MSYTVILPYDPVWLALDWAKKHCPSYITNDAAPHTKQSDIWGPEIRYYFGTEHDAVAFSLRWL
jgi:hypothetical protein